MQQAEGRQAGATGRREAGECNRQKGGRREVSATGSLWHLVRTLFIWMAEGSLKPKSEWSVKMVLSPIVLACKRPSWHRIEKAWRKAACGGVRECEC